MKSKATCRSYPSVLIFNIFDRTFFARQPFSQPGKKLNAPLQIFQTFNCVVNAVAVGNQI